MFKNIRHINSIKYSHIFKITDDDFEEECIADYNTLAFARPIAIINCYSKRNLNVPYNFVLFMKWYVGSTFHKTSIVDLLDTYTIWIKEFEQYKNDVEKYLSLI